ncbi:MAG: PaaI family thioesterase [Magnetospirillum sp.]
MGAHLDGHRAAIACGYADLLGYRVKSWGPGEIVIEVDLGSQHGNRYGRVHGGLIASLIDAAGGLCGSYAAKPEDLKRAVTLSMNVNFLAPSTACRLRAVGRVSGGGRKVFFASVEVTDERHQLVAQGQGSFRYRQ